jgi:hypothetical protein
MAQPQYQVYFFIVAIHVHPSKCSISKTLTHCLVVQSQKNLGLLKCPLPLIPGLKRDGSEEMED